MCVRMADIQSPTAEIRQAPSSLSRKVAHQPQFSARVYCGQTAGWTKMPFGKEVGLGPGDIVLDGHQATLAELGASAPTFRPMSIVAKLLLSSCYNYPSLLPRITHWQVIARQ